jgi:hypothetical protein
MPKDSYGNYEPFKGKWIVELIIAALAMVAASVAAWAANRAIQVGEDAAANKVRFDTNDRDHREIKDLLIRIEDRMDRKP